VGEERGGVGQAARVRSEGDGKREKRRRRRRRGETAATAAAAETVRL